MYDIERGVVASVEARTGRRNLSRKRDRRLGGLGAATLAAGDAVGDGASSTCFQQFHGRELPLAGDAAAGTIGAPPPPPEAQFITVGVPPKLEDRRWKPILRGEFFKRTRVFSRDPRRRAGSLRLYVLERSGDRCSEARSTACVNFCQSSRTINRKVVELHNCT